MINYLVSAITLVFALYGIIISNNLLKKIIALNIFQASIILFYLTVAKVENGSPPILSNLKSDQILYSNPLPHVLMLTAIVVGLTVNAIAIALVIRIKNEYKTIELEDIKQIKLNN